MNKNKLKSIAYLAGIIDGEGCIMISRPHGDFSYYSMRLEVAQKDGKLMDYLIGSFGGSIRDSRNGASVWKWQLSGKKAVELLTTCLPFLVVKKKQAEIAIRWLAAHEKKKLWLEDKHYNDLMAVKRVYSLPSSYRVKQAAETKRVGHESACYSPI